MPGSDLLLRVLSVAFQYGVLLLLFRFIARLAQAMFEDAKVLRQEIKPREILPDEAVLSVVEAGDEALLGKRFAFTQGLTIGRSADNDIRIPDSCVSHRHAVVRLRGHGQHEPHVSKRCDPAGKGLSEAGGSHTHRLCDTEV